MELRPDYPVITARLRLRPLTAADTDDLVAYRCLDDVCRFVPFEPMDAAAVAERLEGGWSRRLIAGQGDAVTLGVELAETGRVIGDVMLFFASAEHRAGEIGWVLHPGYSGHGYATEASHAVLHLAFDRLDLHRVVARVDARNEASLRLGDRLGMRREAYLRSNEWFKGAWSDEIDLAVLDSEWAAQQPAGQGWCSGCSLQPPSPAGDQSGRLSLMSEVAFKSVAPVVPVRDLDVALERYRRLGFEAHAYDGPDRYGYADRGPVSIHLTEWADHDPHRTGAVVYLFVGDADAVYSEWKNSGVEGRFIEPIDARTSSGNSLTSISTAPPTALGRP